MKRLLALAGLTLLLTACIDTKGISPDLSKPPEGNADSVVVVVEYGDYECPSCKGAYISVVQPLLQKYSKQVRFEFHNFPLRSLHPYAITLAEGAECAADQGKFWEYLDMAYKNQEQDSNTIMDTWAKNLSLDQDLFYRCTRSHIKRAAILKEYNQGLALGVQGTPTFFVNGKQIPEQSVTVPDISAAIDAQLKGAINRL